MKMLWDHINVCQQLFTDYLAAKWVETQPYEMEDEVKKLLKTLKDMKVDKRANAYNGLLDEIKKWLIFLPLILSWLTPPCVTAIGMPSALRSRSSSLSMTSFCSRTSTT
jgi:dynein heavy chain